LTLLLMGGLSLLRLGSSSPGSGRMDSVDEPTINGS
jgi:hypothetical protein